MLKCEFEIDYKIGPKFLEEWGTILEIIDITIIKKK